MYNHLTWDKPVQTLIRVLSAASRASHCADKSCTGYEARLLSGEGQQIAPSGFGYGYDVVTRIGWLRQDRHETYAEIQQDLESQVQISVSHVGYLYQQVYLPLLACHERQYKDRLALVAQQYGGLLIGLDGLAPVAGEPQLWFIRELQTGLTLRSGWMSRQDHTAFEEFLRPLLKLNLPIHTVLSDKQSGLLPAVAVILSDAMHQFCHSHYLNNLAGPLSAADATFKTRLRKAVRQEVGVLIRTEQPTDEPQPGVLTVTGLLPDSYSTAEVSVSTEPKQENDVIDHTSTTPSQESIEQIVDASEQQADDIVTSLLRRARYLLTLKGRPPFCLAGVETYQRLQELADFASELLAHRHHPQLQQLSRGIGDALAQTVNDYLAVQQGAVWLSDIDRILKPADDGSSTSDRVKLALRTYLDELLSLDNLPSNLDDFRLHLDKVSTSYWPGLFHCYDSQVTPRTNNELESHFRDTQRQLLRTTGQKGQTRRALERIGAWELLPRPPNEAERFAALRQVESAELEKERQRLRKHLERFRLHTRSTKLAIAQFKQLRQQWLALASTSTG
ncbi:MAG: hypothetical protein ACYST6_18820 [Planctomycetota bacterium]|jgi:hypothetical protein